MADWSTEQTDGPLFFPPLSSSSSDSESASWAVASESDEGFELDFSRICFDLDPSLSS